jgi:mycothiol synthase
MRNIYTIRNYRPADYDKYIQLNIKLEALEPTGYFTAAQSLRESLYRPNYFPEKNLFIVETAGNIVGYMNVTPEVKIGRVILNCLIHPDHRRQGLASELLRYAIHRAKELGVKVAHVNIPEDNITAKSMLSKLGFRFVRRFLELRLDISKVQWQESDQSPIQYRNLKCGEEDKLAQLQNRSFVGTWGYNPNTVEEIAYSANVGDCSPEDIVLACEEDKVIGYCWTRTTYDAATSERKGQIFMLGIDPDYRGRGIGARVLLAGLSYCQSKGLQVTELTVDSSNKAACSLYQSVGFKVKTGSLWYEKTID